MVSLDQAAGHGKPHLAEADESDVHDEASLTAIAKRLCEEHLRRSNPLF
jgi:hypothetical protein